MQTNVTSGLKSGLVDKLFKLCFQLSLKWMFLHSCGEGKEKKEQVTYSQYQIFSKEIHVRVAGIQLIICSVKLNYHKKRSGVKNDLIQKKRQAKLQAIHFFP